MSATWTARAACSGKTNLMFPDPSDMAGIAAAQRVCAACPVQAECAVLARRERNGVWAGRFREKRERVGRPRTREVSSLADRLRVAREKAQRKAAS